MLPNDPLLGLAQSQATMATRIAESQQERLAAAGRGGRAMNTHPQNVASTGHRWSVAMGLLLAAGTLVVGAVPNSAAANSQAVGSIVNRTLAGQAAPGLSSRELAYINRAVGLALSE